MLLSSTLSKTRRRIYSLLGVGLLAALGAAAVGALIVFLGHSRPDVVQPFWEAGEYVAVLGLFNAGIYAALFWQVGRLSRRDGKKSAGASPVLGFDAEDDDVGTPEPSAASGAPPHEHLPPGRPKVIARRVRGSVSSLHLDP